MSNAPDGLVGNPVLCSTGAEISLHVCSHADVSGRP